MFDECDATGQQRLSAVLFSGAFRPGLAASAWASDAYVPLAASSLRNRKGANGWPQLSADSSIVWGQLVGAGFVERGSPSPPSRVIWVLQAAAFGQRSSATSAGTHINISSFEALGCLSFLKLYVFTKEAHLV